MSWSRTLKIRQLIRAQLEAGEEIALLFSDIRGFSTYTARKGDRAAYQLARLHEGILRERIDEYGIIVKSLGDGIMAAFETPLRAIRAAVEIQRAIRERNQRTPDDPIDVGIGVSSGTPVMTDIDFIGHAVNLAQRLSSLAKGGQILVTERVQRSTSLPESLRYIPLGPRTLKGLGIENVFEVTWLRERARVSDEKDRITVILTDRRTMVVELAKDTKQELREALEQLARARREEEGALSAMLQRGIARLAQRLIRGSLDAFGVVREQAVDRISVTYRRSTLRIESPQGTLELRGVPHDAAEQFIAAADELRDGGHAPAECA